jgi:opacity protein-like surface antigen
LENLSAEIRLAGGMFGSNEDYNDESDTTTINVDLKYHYGAYLKYNILNKGDLSPYAVLGFTRSKAIRSSVDSDLSVGENEESEIAIKNSYISYGLGFDYALNNSSSLNFEYMNYIDSGNASINGFSFGIKELF